MDDLLGSSSATVTAQRAEIQRLEERVAELERRARRPGPDRAVRLSFVVQRYGAEVAGGAEALCPPTARALAERGDEVEV